MNESTERAKTEETTHRKLAVEAAQIERDERKAGNKAEADVYAETVQWHESRAAELCAEMRGDNGPPVKRVT